MRAAGLEIRLDATWRYPNNAPMSQTPSSWQTYKRLLGYVKPYRAVFIAGILSMAFMGFAGLGGQHA